MRIEHADSARPRTAHSHLLDWQLHAASLSSFNFGQQISERLQLCLLESRNALLVGTPEKPREPPRVSRRPVGLSQAATSAA
jgi:hypothetical protein